MIRALKRHKDAVPFLQAVDPVKLGILDYLLIIKQPMDLTTVSNNLDRGVYTALEDFVSGIQLVFDNCFTYNPPQNAVHQMGRAMEKVFNAHLRRMPKPAPPPPPTPAASRLPLKSTPKSVQPARSASSTGRPRRDIHPPSKDLPMEELPRKKAGRRYLAEMRWCSSIQRDLMKKQHAPYVNFPLCDFNFR